jgi:glycerate dehydrogenase
MPEPKHIAFLDAATIPEGIERPAPDFPHRWQSYPVTALDERIGRLQDTHIALTNKVVIDRPVLEACPRLELVAVTATGVNNIDLAACREAGVHVANVKGYATRSVAEWCLSQLLNLCWNHALHRHEQEQGQWAESSLFNHLVAPIRELGTLRVGILGRGDIGRALEKRLSACGARVDFLERPNAAAPREGYRPFSATLPELDALVLCCPLTEDNQGLIDSTTLARLKPGAFLVNPARGALLVEADVAEAVTAGRLGGLAVDVLSREPAGPDNPVYRLRERPDVIITPHIAWCSRESVTTLMARTVDNLNRFVAGERSFCLV